MATTFPDTPAFTGFNEPCRFEGEVYDLVVTGTLPPALAGTFYRCGPDPQWPPLLGDDVRFNGDGMVSMFRFAGGRVDFRSRYVRTEKFVLERAARRALFGAYRNPFTDDPSVRGKIRGTANTHIIPHAGTLLALKEDSPPVALDPDSLETIGNWDFAGKLTSQTFTAHPKIDPATGEMFCFGYAATGISTRDVAYYVIDAQGSIIHEVWFEMPYAAMMHDWVVTQDYVVFPVVPITSDIERTKAGRPAFMWDDRQDVFLGVLPRFGTASDLRWFRGPCRFAAHFMNGWNDGPLVHVDAVAAEGNVFPFFPDVRGAAFDPQKALTYLTRWTIDLAADGDGYTETRLSATPTLPNAHGFMLSADPDKPYAGNKLMFNSVAHHDYARAKTTLAYAGDGCGFQEPVFVPRSPGASEGDGYLVIVRNRLLERASDVVVLDVADLSADPVATIAVPVRLRDAIHGSWVAA
jgi:carotenoid cleavage dioxygenase-like enzyme